MMIFLNTILINIIFEEMVDLYEMFHLFLHLIPCLRSGTGDHQGVG